MELKTIGNLSFVGLIKEFSVKNGENFKQIPLFWNEVMTNGAFQKLFPLCDELGVVGVSYGYNPETETFKYMIGIRHNEEVEGYESVSFDEETYASFKAVGVLPEALQTVIKEVFSDWLPNNGTYQHSGGPEIEVYPMGDGSKDDYVSYIMIPVIKK